MAQKARMTFRFDQNGSPLARGSDGAAPREPGPGTRPAGRDPTAFVKEATPRREKGAGGAASGSARPADRFGGDGPFGADGVDDIDRLERLIRETDPSGAPFSEEADKPALTAGMADDAAGDGPEPEDAYGLADRGGTDAAGWGDEPDGGEDRPKIDASSEWVWGGVGWNGQRAGHEQAPSWLRVFFAVAGAVATGAAFGWLVLHLFVGSLAVPGVGSAAPDGGLAVSPSAGADKPAATAPAGPGAASGESGAAEPAAPGAREPDAAQAGVSTEPGTPGATDATVSLSDSAVVPADLFYLLQYGVFSSADGMREAVREARAKGLAVAAFQDDGYRVFVGVASTRDDAERLAELLDGTPVYIKVLEGDPVTLPRDGSHADVPAFFERGGELARQLARLSLSALRQDRPAKIGEEEMRRLREAHDAWKRAADAIGGDEALPDEARTLAQAAGERLDAAFSRLEDYQDSLSRDDLTDTQTAVMEALLSMRRLRETLQPAEPPAKAEEANPAEPA